jgi:hypothetical protein
LHHFTSNQANRSILKTPCCGLIDGYRQNTCNSLYLCCLFIGLPTAAAINFYFLFSVKGTNKAAMLVALISMSHSPVYADFTQMEDKATASWLKLRSVLDLNKSYIHKVITWPHP